jgi:hypothetical protein
MDSAFFGVEIVVAETLPFIVSDIGFGLVMSFVSQLEENEDWRLS